MKLITKTNAIITFFVCNLEIKNFNSTLKNKLANLNHLYCVND